MTITLNGSTGINTPGVVNTAASTVGTTLGVTGVTTIAAGSAAAPALVGTTGGTTTGVFFPAASTVAFANGGVESARIDSSGRFLLGVTSPLTVAYMSVGGWNSATYLGTVYQPSNSGAFTAVGFNNSAGTQQGNINCTGSGTTSFTTSSDYRLKENVAPMAGALAKVAALKPVTYKWKVNGSDGEGFIAHELAEVCPDAVHGEKDAIDENGKIKPQGIDTSFLVATLTAAIQEQQALITSLTTRITALENK